MGYIIIEYNYTCTCNYVACIHVHVVLVNYIYMYILHTCPPNHFFLPCFYLYFSLLLTLSSIFYVTLLSCIFISMSPCLSVSMSLCLSVSLSLCLCPRHNNNVNNYRGNQVIIINLLIH